MVQFGLFFWGPPAAEALRLVPRGHATMPRDMNVVIACHERATGAVRPEQHHFVPGYAMLLTGLAPPRNTPGSRGIRSRLPPCSTS